VPRARRHGPLPLAAAKGFAGGIDLAREAARVAALAGIPCPEVKVEAWDRTPNRSATAYTANGTILLRLGLSDAEPAALLQTLLHEIAHFAYPPYPQGDRTIAHGPPFRRGLFDLCLLAYGAWLPYDLPFHRRDATATLDRRMVRWFQETDIPSKILHLQGG